MAYGKDYLKNKLAQKKTRVDVRYKYYEMKNATVDFNISSPENLRYWQSVIGWCAKAVDSMADRLVFREFRNDNFNLTEIFNLNNPDVFFDSAVLSALISSCCFVYISPGVDKQPRLQILDGGDATGVIDTFTGFLNEGYAVLDRDKKTGRPTLEAYFLPGKTTYYERGKETRSDIYNVQYPLLVPIINRPDARRPFGHSRISRACMSLVGSATRSIKRAEISAEFYSFPQKYVSGLAQDTEFDKFKATMSSFVSGWKDEDGDHPTFGQFTQQSMTPHTDQLRMFASLFAGEAGLTLDDLGFATENPASAEAIKASHENMRVTARKAQRTFGSGFLNVGILAASLRDNTPYLREQFYLTKPVWAPLFEPDMATLGLIGDGANKINQAVPGFFSAQTLYDLTGIPPASVSASTAVYDLDALLGGEVANA